MHGTQAGNTCIADALQGTEPQVKVGINGILDQDGHLVVSLQLVGDALDGKGVGRRAGSNPQDVNACIQGRTDMLDRSHLGRKRHSRFLPDLLQPFQADVPHAFKSAGHGARFPDACPENFHAYGRQGTRRVERLLLALGTTRSGNNGR